MRARRLLALCLACVSLAARGAPPGKPAPAGVAAFAKHARYVSAAISPKGTYLAAISTETGKRTLVVVDLAKRSIASALKPAQDAMVSRVHWANDDRLVVELVASNGELARPVSHGELYAVNADGSGGRMIFGYRAGEMQTGSHIRKAEKDEGWARVIATLPGESRQILIGTENWWDTADQFVRIQKLDVYTGLKTPVGQAPIRRARVLADEQGEARLALAADEHLKSRVFLRDAGTWSELASLKGVAATAVPMAYGARDRTLYLLDGDTKGFRLDAVPLDGGERRLLSRNDMVPPTSVLRDSATGRPFAVEYEPDLPTYDFPDPEHPLSRLLKGLLAAFPDDHVRLHSWTQDARKTVVEVFSDRNPGKFLVADVEKLTVEPVLEARPWIRPEEMAEKTAFHVKASDGLWIHGYVTLPGGRPAGSAPPMVVLPHGGPHGVRDDWAFDPEVQLLAREGFAVLQVNYRGSGGYGDGYEEAGYGKWSGRVVEDLLDATRWAVKKGHADPRRICFYGASFGAYASMQAAVLAPELVRCAVGYAGVYDLTRLGTDDDFVLSRLAQGHLRNMVGKDEAALQAASPSRNAARLKARVLLVHGTEDSRAPIGHAEALRDALTAAGRPPEWLVEPGEGHGFYDEQARERMYTRLVAFLKENTAAAAAAAPQAATPAVAAPAPAAAAPAR